MYGQMIHGIMNQMVKNIKRIARKEFGLEKIEIFYSLRKNAGYSSIERRQQGARL